MARTHEQRFKSTVEYIADKVDRQLAKDIEDSTDDEKKAGEAISLAGGGFWHHGTQEQHWALRALLLCQQTFMSGNNVNMGVRALLPEIMSNAKLHYRDSSIADIQKAINAYIQLPQASSSLLATEGETAKPTGTQIQFHCRTREDSSFGSANPVCFDAVRVLLFRAGFVSLRWLVAEGFNLDAYHCNTMLGDGDVVSPDSLDRMPRGWIFNFHSAQSKSVCHWGISLGGGRAVGANTSPAWGTSTLKQTHFYTGGSFYGEFDMRSSYEVCRLKYALPHESEADVIIRQVNPTSVTTYR